MGFGTSTTYVKKLTAAQRLANIIDPDAYAEGPPPVAYGTPKPNGGFGVVGHSQTPAKFKGDYGDNLGARFVPGLRRTRQPPQVRWSPGGVSSGPFEANGIYGGVATPTIKKLVLDLSVARNDVQFPIIGTILWYYFGTNATDQMLIRIGNVTNDQFRWGPGNGIEGMPFTSIFVTNSVIAAASAEIAYFTDSENRPARFF